MLNYLTQVITLDSEDHKESYKLPQTKDNHHIDNETTSLWTILYCSKLTY